MTATITGLGWREHAACLHADPEMFFPVGVAQAALDCASRAKAVCAGCPVRAACLDYAQATNQDAGIWGGLDETARRALRRRRRNRRDPQEKMCTSCETVKPLAAFGWLCGGRRHAVCAVCRAGDRP